MIRDKRVVDSFLFFNEVEMAYFRMKELDSFVDVFLIIEAKTSFSGNPKELNYFKHRHKFREFRSKVVYRTYRGGTSPNAWDNERAQRNFIKTAYLKFANDNDLFCLSDVDEIPNFNSIKPNHTFDKPHVFKMDMYKYNLTNLHSRGLWRGTKMIFWNAFKLQFSNMEDFRLYNKLDCIEIQNGGWHLTYFGGVEMITRKIEGFSHQELNRPEFKSETHILNAIKNGDDLFNRPSITEHIEIEENTNLPKHIDILI